MLPHSSGRSPFAGDHFGFADSPFAQRKALAGRHAVRRPDFVPTRRRSLRERRCAEESESRHRAHEHQGGEGRIFHGNAPSVSPFTIGFAPAADGTVEKRVWSWAIPPVDAIAAIPVRRSPGDTATSAKRRNCKI